MQESSPGLRRYGITTSYMDRTLDIVNEVVGLGIVSSRHCQFEPAGALAGRLDRGFDGEISVGAIEIAKINLEGEVLIV